MVGTHRTPCHRSPVVTFLAEPPPTPPPPPLLPLVPPGGDPWGTLVLGGCGACPMALSPLSCGALSPFRQVRTALAFHGVPKFPSLGPCLPMGVTHREKIWGEERRGEGKLRGVCAWKTSCLPVYPHAVSQHPQSSTTHPARMGFVSLQGSSTPPRHLGGTVCSGSPPGDAALGPHIQPVQAKML